MFNSRDSKTDRSAGLRDEKDYTVPFQVGIYLVRNSDPDIIDKVHEYKIDGEGISVQLSLDINHNIDEILSDYFPADVLKESHKRYHGFFVRGMSKSLKPNLGFGRRR